MLNSRLWQGIGNGDGYDMQTALFQAMGGMGRISEASAASLGLWFATTARSQTFVRTRRVSRFIRSMCLCLSLAPLAFGDDSAFTSSAGIGSVDGAGIYTHICQGCHMPGAQGAIGAGHYPKLAGKSWKRAPHT